MGYFTVKKRGQNCLSLNEWTPGTQKSFEPEEMFKAFLFCSKSKPRKSLKLKKKGIFGNSKLPKNSNKSKSSTLFQILVLKFSSVQKLQKLFSLSKAFLHESLESLSNFSKPSSCVKSQKFSLIKNGHKN